MAVQTYPTGSKVFFAVPPFPSIKEATVLFHKHDGYHLLAVRQTDTGEELFFDQSKGDMFYLADKKSHLTPIVKKWKKEDLLTMGFPTPIQGMKVYMTDAYKDLVILQGSITTVKDGHMKSRADFDFILSGNGNMIDGKTKYGFCFGENNCKGKRCPDTYDIYVSPYLPQIKAWRATKAQELIDKKEKELDLLKSYLDVN